MKRFCQILLLAGYLGFCGAASGSIIFESATLGVTGATGGATVNDAQFLGVRFAISAPTQVDSVAGHLSILAGDIFAAIVSLSGPTATPTGDPFDISEVIASVVFAPGNPSDEYSVPMSVLLSAGNYGLIFGSGQFGASGLAIMPNGASTGGCCNSGASNIGSPSYFGWGSVAGWFEIANDQGGAEKRFVVNGEVLAEPTTLLLLGLGLGVIGYAKRRRPLQP